MNNTNQTPPDLRPIEHALDELAQADRRSAPATLESRVFMATRGLLGEGAQAQAGPPVVVQRVSFTKMQLAAAVAVVGAVVAVWVAQLQYRTARSVDGAGQASLQRLEDDITLLLAIKSDGALSTTADAIDALFLETATLGESLRRADWQLPDEGAM